MSFLDYVAAFLFRRRWRGATRFHATFLRGRRVETKSRHGIIFQLDPGEHVDQCVLSDGFYEEEVMIALTENLQDDEVFWDVGSNLGLHALTVRLLKPNVRVYAFEPNPQMSTLIRTAAQRNSLTLDVIELALDVETGHADFFLQPGNAGMGSLHNWREDATRPRIKVTTVTGDGVVSGAQARSPNVMKIDVEGNERRVLQGMAGVLGQRSLHTIVFEDSPDSTSPVKTILREHGFRIEVLNRRENTQHNLENFVARRSVV